jgi:prepilin-type N-terminal cleavage/methylation domain-containing protein
MTAVLPPRRPHPTTAAGLRSRGARRRERGFTLIEIAIAIFIITILLGSILVPLTTQVEQRQVAETRKMLEDIRTALIGHAVTYGRLPCPDRITVGTGGPNDTSNDGVEDYNTGTGACFSTTQTGNVPWVTLGFGATDPWGNRFRYRVDADYAHRTIPVSFTTTADLCVGPNQPACATPLPTRFTAASPDGAIAVIISHGRNGYGAIKAETNLPGNAGVQNPCHPSGCSADENDNAAGGTGYSYRPHTSFASPCGGAGQPACEFDDVVVWIGKFTLFNRMVAAGKLP